MKNTMLILVLFLLSSCKGNKDKQGTDIPLIPVFTELQNKAKAIFGVLPGWVDSPISPITDEKVQLGKTLYFDPVLSKNGTQSCNTCHNLSTYGVDNKAFSPGDAEGTIGVRNSPSTLNAALHTAQFWDGRAKTLEEQAGKPILNPIEMGIPDEKFAVERLKNSEKYRKMFASAFPEDKDPVNWNNLTIAIGAFERKLITPSRFDKYIAGDDKAITDKEKQGLQDFIDVGCITCHTGPALGGNSFQKFGVYKEYWKETKSAKIDAGKSDISKNDAEKYMFKVPSLRNIAKTAPYFHDGSVKDLKEAIRIMGKIQLDKELTPDQVDNIFAFFGSLTGELNPELAKAPQYP
ncbi:cytochrome C peroxidase [Chryseobacterium gallinarum]|uniref:Cytochrome C peroxidase n=1 Tax=Chryseobacterium gallinarum TaxID=1324352 RepID=A0A0G3M3T9_CHRGL|nr:cytochrome-c peroxidase [Chryseobacterium gallinarum]AKK71692.1 cytochrome C peroxidase [Chryseobacterium gallinarum]MCL8535286.1 cytochrome-c peroxidase [Chryseobacterium gallinarum]